VDQGTFVFVLFLIWAGMGLVGTMMLLGKGKLAFSAAVWVIFGWWGLLAAIAFGGGIVLWAGIAAKADVPCPHCREKAKWDATKCPRCHSVLEPAG
jgi:hypothetical protein